MEEYNGKQNFRNEIIWYYPGGLKAVPHYFPSKHDNILVYSKSSDYTFNVQRKNSEDNSLYSRWIKYSTDGETITYKNFPRTDRVKFDMYVKRFISQNNKYPQDEDVIYKFEGALIDDVWSDCPAVFRLLSEKTNYPTQKPESLMSRIISSFSNEGDLIFDCFMGSGTTQAVAMKLGRRFIGADINLGAIDTTIKRLNKVAKEIKEKFTGEQILYTGFEVYNVNNYDVFRNPIQAKDLLVQALELQPLPNNDLYDGEKDGRLVKIMPVNRIATRADLNELITGFPRDKFDKRKAESPNKPVEYITLVCMGHEPDLGANLKLQMKEEGYNIDVEVLDILRDKVNLEFRRDSEADVQIEGDRLVIREFFPMNLLQKLSMEKTNVEEWRELVDSIKIDFNFDGAVFSPSVIDIPEGKDLVKGSYKIPADAGTIKVKITDLLSESCEVTINA